MHDALHVFYGPSPYNVLFISLSILFLKPLSISGLHCWIASPCLGCTWVWPIQIKAAFGSCICEGKKKGKVICEANFSLFFPCFPFSSTNLSRNLRSKDSLTSFFCYIVIECNFSVPYSSFQHVKLDEHILDWCKLGCSCRIPISTCYLIAIYYEIFIFILLSG